jgi:hypothetical protein
MDEFFFFSLFGGSVVAALGFAAAWYRARRRLDRLEADLLRPRIREDDLGDIDDRLNDLAAQVGELARSQDFLHRMITRRLDRLPPAEPDRRVITPH